MNRRDAAGYAGLAALAIAVNLPVLSFPYVQDDWDSLEYVAGGFPAVRAVLFPGGVLYRPLGFAYFWMLRELFGLNPWPAHAIGLALHTASGLLIASVLLRIVRDRSIAFGSAALYVAATSVLMEPLLWASGFLDLGGMCFALLAIRLILDRRAFLSAMALGLALLCKESTVFAALLIAAWAIAERMPVRSMIPMAVVVAVWGRVKLLGGSPLDLPANHPYVVAFSGAHLVENLERYGRWAIQAVAPFMRVGFGAIAAGAGLAAVSAWLARSTVAPRAYAALLLWILCGAVPFFFLPNQQYRYYLIAPLPAILALGLMTLHAPVRRAFGPRAASAAVAIFVACSSAASAWYLRNRLAHPAEIAEGTNGLAGRAQTVIAVRDALLARYPSLPAGTVLLFRGIELWAFSQHSGPRVWYGDPTLRAYDAADARIVDGRLSLVNPPEGQLEAYIPGQPRVVPLDPERVLVVEWRDGRVSVERW